MSMTGFGRFEFKAEKSVGLSQKPSLQSVVRWSQQSFLVPSAFIATIILKIRVGWQSPKRVKLNG